VAIDSGNKDEKEPLFIGSPANHAAKLAVGIDEGIFLSKRAQTISKQPTNKFAAEQSLGDFGSMRVSNLLEDSLASPTGLQTGLARDMSAQVEAAFARVQVEIGDVGGNPSAKATFNFHQHEPPLKTINFADHPPSNAIRMTVASIFADIDGFTKYIDDAIISGQVRQAVSNLFVIRSEMNAVLRAEFGGRKIRFIGDCIHGVIAEGTRLHVDEAQTVKAAIAAAAGIRSSFELCQRLLPGAAGLGLAIGIELGETPICRIGLRGTNSVRCAVSRATCVSEEIQQACDGQQTALGQTAYTAADVLVRAAFRGDRTASNLDWVAASLLLNLGGEPQAAPAHAPLRAHQVETPHLRAHTDSQ
jgi:class 3 adenylate cyclase